MSAKDYDTYDYDGKEVNGKIILSRFAYELFDEEKNTASKMVRVKRTFSNAKGESWKVFENDKVVFVLDGNKLSKKERDYLRTYEGFSFLLKEAKSGIKSLHGIKNKLKQIVK